MRNGSLHNHPYTPGDMGMMLTEIRERQGSHGLGLVPMSHVPRQHGRPVPLCRCAAVPPWRHASARPCAPLFGTALCTQLCTRQDLVHLAGTRERDPAKSASVQIRDSCQAGSNASCLDPCSNPLEA